MPSVAVVGAGISGLTCARMLADHGFPVTVFEKSRGVGGRMATRRTPNGLRFDHGAQYFTARDRQFRKYVESWIQDGVVRSWNANIVVLADGAIKERKSGTDRFVATPGMNAICKHLANGVDVRFQTQIASIDRTSDQWQMKSTDGADLGVFDVAIVSAPAIQSANLLSAVPDLADQARGTEMSGCWAMMLAFESSLGLDFAGAFVHESAISWIANNRSKPERGDGPETWVLHASADWSEAHMEQEAATIERLLIEEFWNATGLAPTEPSYVTSHRWRFAIPPNPLAESCLFDEALRIGACGDWCAGPRVEGAFLSGVAAADRVLDF